MNNNLKEIILCEISSDARNVTLIEKLVGSVKKTKGKLRFEINDSEYLFALLSSDYYFKASNVDIYFIGSEIKIIL